MITIEFDHRLDEHLRADRLHYRKKSWFARGDKVVAIIMALFGLLVTIAGVRWGLVFVAVAPLEWFDVLSPRPLIARHVFKRSKKFHERTSLTFSEPRIHYRTPSIDSTLDWGLFSELVEDDALFLLLYRAPRAYAVIPKRAFATEAAQAEFRRLATSKLVRAAA